MQWDDFPPEFEWDPAKDIANAMKHGVSFDEARQAFCDKQRVIMHDPLHSHGEIRYYCYGLVNDRVLTVRFTMREHRYRIIGAAYWRKGKHYYGS